MTLETLILCFLTYEWQDTNKIARLCNQPVNKIANCLATLKRQDKIDYSSESSNLSYHSVIHLYRLKENQKDENQTTLDL